MSVPASVPIMRKSLSLSLRQAAGLLWIALALVIAGCGGGGDMSSQRPTASVVTADGAAVGKLQVLDGTGSRASVGGRGLQYAWQIVEAPDSSFATLSDVSAASTSFTPDYPGTYRISLIVSDGTLSSAPVVTTITAAQVLWIHGPEEPIGGTASFYISGNYGGAVRWFVDGQLAGTTTMASPIFSWNTSAVINGVLQVEAVFDPALNSGIERLHRRLAVFNQPPESSAVAIYDGDTIAIRATVLSGRDIARVQFTVSDNNTGFSYSQPNFCEDGELASCEPSRLRYQFTVDKTGLEPGTHIVTVRATDTLGLISTIEVPFQIDTSPVVTVDQPRRGSILYGSVTVSGSVASGVGAVDEVEVLIAGSSHALAVVNGAFSGSIDLTDASPGPRDLVVTAASRLTGVGSARHEVAIAPSPDLAFQPVFLMPAEAIHYPRFARRKILASRPMAGGCTTWTAATEWHWTYQSSLPTSTASSDRAADNSMPSQH